MHFPGTNKQPSLNESSQWRRVVNYTHINTTLLNLFEIIGTLIFPFIYWQAKGSSVIDLILACRDKCLSFVHPICYLILE